MICMNGEMRRKKITDRLLRETKPVSASNLAEYLGVSRQVIVQDVALLRAAGVQIESLSRGYVIQKKAEVTRVFKVHHSDDDVGKELDLIVDSGGKVIDVFVYHRVYGKVSAPLNISSRLQVRQFLESIASGKSSLLKNVTSGYHYHTVSSDSLETLRHIGKMLDESGFLAPLQEYEPEEVSEQ